MKHVTRIAVIGIFSLIASGAYAQKAGDWLVNVGWPKDCQRCGSVTAAPAHGHGKDVTTTVNRGKL